VIFNSLDLSITKQLVDLLGVNIGVSSIEGEGSLFLVELGLHPMEQSSIALPHEAVIRTETLSSSLGKA
tara:strand:- start:2994 stop:3200 length:207 start_codon:yes stop_codon:yes gene_type:complete